MDWIARMKASGRRTTAAEASVIAAQLISALSFCHVRDIGHFDLKPGNVFTMADSIEVNNFDIIQKLIVFQIKLGDFGSALTIQSATQSLRTDLMTEGVASFTQIYAAPGKRESSSPFLFRF